MNHCSLLTFGHKVEAEYFYHDVQELSFKLVIMTHVFIYLIVCVCVLCILLCNCSGVCVVALNYEQGIRKSCKIICKLSRDFYFEGYTSTVVPVLFSLCLIKCCHYILWVYSKCV